MRPSSHDTLETKQQADPRVSWALDSRDVNYEVDSEGDFRVGFELEDGRAHDTFIRSDTGDFGALEVRDIFAIAGVFVGELAPNLANALLIMNGRLKLGSWRIMRGGDSDDQSALAFGVQVDANAGGRRLIEALHFVATRADEVEKQLTGEDNF